MKVLFPSCEVNLADPIRRPGEAPVWQGSGTILLVDDEEVVLAISRTMLERVGFKVLAALDGADAIEIFRSNSSEIVCVLLDNTMPGMSGEQVFRALREVHSDVKVILCSGYSEEEATSEFQQGDLAGLLQKPYGFGSLMKRIRKVAGS